MVTGGAGFIGSALVARLHDQGHTVRVLDNFITGRRDNVPADVDLHEGDLRSEEDAVRACDGIDIVFHQAAVRSVPRSVDEPQLANDCNVTGTLNLLIAASRAGVSRLIYASSSSVYGDTEGALNVESLAPNPRSPYAVSKLAGEYYCRVWTLLGRMPTISLRYFNVFGPGQRKESLYAAVFPAFVSALLDGEAPEVHWDGEQSRDFTYIDDVVAANLAAAAAPEDSFGLTFNVASGRPKTINDVLQAIAREVGIWVEPRFTPKRVGDVRATAADISLARRILDWNPELDWADSVRRTVDWFRGESGVKD